LPCGMKSVAGGTRNAIKLNRPWQQLISPNPETCPFCKGEGFVLNSFHDGEWLLLKNQYTPYLYHRVVIPRTCWLDSDLRMLGGLEKIIAAINLIYHDVRAVPFYKVYVNVHVGIMAGQNIPHLHYHIVSYAFNDEKRSNGYSEIIDSMIPDKKNESLVVMSNARFRVLAHGVRAGQCVIFPQVDRFGIVDKNSSSSLACLLHDFIHLCNEKWRSTQRISPDYSLGFFFQRSHTYGEFMLQYALYTPVLNFWGSAEHIALFEHGTPIAMPWTHEQTAEYLRS